MQPITTIGFDIAKSVFQVHGVDAAGEMVSLPIAFVVLLIRAWPSSQTGGRSLSRLVSKFPPKFAICARIRILCSIDLLRGRHGQ